MPVPPTAPPAAALAAAAGAAKVAATDEAGLRKALPPRHFRAEMQHINGLLDQQEVAPLQQVHFSISWQSRGDHAAITQRSRSDHVTIKS